MVLASVANRVIAMMRIHVVEFMFFSVLFMFDRIEIYRIGDCWLRK